jgi:sec-independent protein translocase protein TatA
MAVVGLLGGLSGTELLIILLIVVLLFGARRIPELARGLGEGIRNFRSAMKDTEREGNKDEPRDGSRGSKTQE